MKYTGVRCILSSGKIGCVIKTGSYEVKLREMFFELLICANLLRIFFLSDLLSNFLDLQSGFVLSKHDLCPPQIRQALLHPYNFIPLL